MPTKKTKKTSKGTSKPVSKPVNKAKVTKDVVKAVEPTEVVEQPIVKEVEPVTIKGVTQKEGKGKNKWWQIDVSVKAKQIAALTLAFVIIFTASCLFTAFYGGAKLDRMTKKYNEMVSKYNESVAKYNDALSKYDDSVSKYDELYALFTDDTKIQELSILYAEQNAKYNELLAFQAELIQTLTAGQVELMQNFAVSQRFSAPSVKITHHNAMQMPIAAMVFGMNAAAINHAAVYGIMADAGFNTAIINMATGAGVDQTSFLDAINANELSLILCGGAGPIAAVGDIVDSNAFWGEYVWMEPNMDMTGTNNLQVAAAAKDTFFEKYDSNKLFYGELRPAYSGNSHESSLDDSLGYPLDSFYATVDGNIWNVYRPAYVNYITSFMETVKPQFINWDAYVVTANGIKQSFWLDTLSVYAKVANDHGVPHWVTLQAFGSPSEESLAGGGVLDIKDFIFFESMKVPEVADALWMVNTCLAYGVKGFTWWTYDDVPVFGDPGLGMVDETGEITKPLYDAVTVANAQINSVSSILIDSAFRGVMTSGSTPVNPADKLAFYKQLKKVSGGDFLVGCFDHYGKTALYVVNTSETETKTATLDFTSKVAGKQIDRSGSENFYTANLSIELGAGEGQLILLN